MMKTTQMTVISLADLAKELCCSNDYLRSLLLDEEDENRQEWIIYDPSKIAINHLSTLEKRIFDYITENFGGDPVLIKNTLVYKVTLIKKEVIYVEASDIDEATDKACAVADNDEAYFFPLDPIDEFQCEVAVPAEYADTTVY